MKIGVYTRIKFKEQTKREETMATQIDKKKKIKKFVNCSPCVCFNIKKSARAITQVYDGLFRPLGLRVSQLSILNPLKMIGSLTVLELAEATATDRTTITRNIKPLVRDGYIKVKTGSDRRSREIVITAKGEAIAEKAMGIWGKYHAKITRKIGKERIEQLCKDLSVMMDGICQE